MTQPAFAKYAGRDRLSTDIASGVTSSIASGRVSRRAGIDTLDSRAVARRSTRCWMTNSAGNEPRRGGASIALPVVSTGARDGFSWKRFDAGEHRTDDEETAPHRR